MPPEVVSYAESLDDGQARAQEILSRIRGLKQEILVSIAQGQGVPLSEVLRDLDRKANSRTEVREAVWSLVSEGSAFVTLDWRLKGLA